MLCVSYLKTSEKRSDKDVSRAGCEEARCRSDSLESMLVAKESVARSRVLDRSWIGLEETGRMEDIDGVYRLGGFRESVSDEG